MRPPIDPHQRDYKPGADWNPPNAPAEDEADILARVYALILSWPTADEKQAGRRPPGRSEVK